MGRSLLLRLLAVSLAVVSLAVVATTLLATYGAGDELREEAESSASLLETDSDIRAALLAYARDHGDWDGVDSLVRDLAEQTGRRIALTDRDGQLIADSAELLGQGAAGLPSTAAARIDATDPPSTVLRPPPPDGQLGSDVAFAYQGWQLTEQEKQQRQALADQAVACLKRSGVDASIEVGTGVALTAYARVLAVMSGTEAPDEPGAANQPEGGPHLRTHPCVPDELYAPSALAREVNGQVVELATACLDEHGVDYDIAVDSYDMRVVRPAAGGDVPAAWTECQQAARVDAMRPHVAPPADLYLGTSDRFDPFSAEGWRRAAATAGGVLLVTATVTVLAGRRLVRPIRALTAAAQRMEAGDRAARVPVAGRDEVTRLAAAFNSMAAAIERGDEQRKALVSDVAHELRTPLANVRSSLEAAEDGVVALDASLIQSLREESALLERLVSDLQDLALADAGMLRVHPEERDAADLAAQAVAAHRAQAEAAGVTLRLDAPSSVPVLADPARLRQALGNLVSNAVTHTPPGGTVTVTVRHEEDEAVLTVADTGPGITAEHLPRVFDRFYRADPSRTRATGGSGLGLAITKHLVEAHGGNVGVASEAGSGAVFTIRVPVPASP